MRLKHILTAAAATAALATGASAASITFLQQQTYVDQGIGFGDLINNVGGSAEILFSYTDPGTGTQASPFYSYVDFETSNLTTITLEDYQPTSTGDQASFFFPALNWSAHCVSIPRVLTTYGTPSRRAARADA